MGIISALEIICRGNEKNDLVEQRFKQMTNEIKNYNQLLDEGIITAE